MGDNHARFTCLQEAHVDLSVLDFSSCEEAAQDPEGALHMLLSNKCFLVHQGPSQQTLMFLLDCVCHSRMPQLAYEEMVQYYMEQPVAYGR